VDYERRLQSVQSTMQSIQQAYLGTWERAVVVLEGWDTAGKGGIVRRLGWAMDPRSFKVYPIAAPLPHEQGRHYLQRFWEKLPEPGQIVVFDRSWYGRVLVERVEAFASKPPTCCRGRRSRPHGGGPDRRPVQPADHSAPRPSDAQWPRCGPRRSDQCRSPFCLAAYYCKGS
jgi:hypothetical protein